MESEVETKLLEKRMEILQIEEQIKGLTEQKTELKTQVDQGIRYLEMAKELFTSDILSSADRRG
jgi:cell division initiation protein